MFELYKTSIETFGLLHGTVFYFKTYLVDMKLYLFWCKITRKKWCTYYGYSCKDKNCTYKHLDEPRQCCNAILKFDGTEYFVMCEKYKRHRGNHEAIGFVWERGTKKCHNSYRLRHMNLMKLHMKR